MTRIQGVVGHVGRSCFMAGARIVLACLVILPCVASVLHGQATYEVVKAFDRPFLNGASPTQVIQVADGSFYGTTRSGGAYNGGTIFTLDAAGTLTTLVSLPFDGVFEGLTRTPLILATDGQLYGTTRSDGAYDAGTVYKVDGDGTRTVVYTFTGGADGGWVSSKLFQATDGRFYGVTNGGPGGLGTVFTLDAAGTLTTLHTFTGGSDGWQPVAVLQGTDGNLYGTTRRGGTLDIGTVFKLDPSGVLTTLHSFVGGGDGALPFGDLIQASDGYFYGTTSGGGHGPLTVFKIDTAGILTTFHTFTEGGILNEGLVQAADGNFYGTMNRGGAFDGGLVFKIDAAGTFTIVHSFAGGSEGVAPLPGLIQAADGSFYGTTGTSSSSTAPPVVFAGGTVFKLAAAGTLTTFYGFPGGTDGAQPNAALTRAADGSFYGTTVYGGQSNLGTVFKLDAAGILTTLQSFIGSNGAKPYAGLTQATDGHFYGTTAGGGESDAGTVFKLDAAGPLTALHSFVAAGQGWYPVAGLIQAADGLFYGTTYKRSADRGGMVFRIDGAGTFKKLHYFTDDAHPAAELIQGADGSFYGTTVGGGAFNLGMVFKRDPAGIVTTLHSFTGGSDGGDPHAGLIQSTDGSFYGTTSWGGASTGGTVFKLDAAGTLTTLHSFSGGDGAQPNGGVIEASDGSHYGTTTNGGAANAGTVFKLDAAGVLTTLHSFSGSDGAKPHARLALATDGSFYGTASEGGPNGGGVVYRLTLSPPGSALTLSLSKTLISACLKTTAKVTLMSPAPAGGTVVTLSSSNFHATVPASVKVAAGKTIRSFSVTTSPVTALETAIIEATVGSAPASSQALMLRPMAPKSVTLSPNPVVGGSPVSAAVTLECAAGPGDIVVTLSSSKPAIASLTTPTVTVPFGMTAAPFDITTVPVTGVTKAAIKATANGVTKSKTITVNPGS